MQMSLASTFKRVVIDELKVVVGLVDLVWGSEWWLLIGLRRESNWSEKWVGEGECWKVWWCWDVCVYWVGRVSGFWTVDSTKSTKRNVSSSKSSSASSLPSPAIFSSLSSSKSFPSSPKSNPNPNPNLPSIQFILIISWDLFLCSLSVCVQGKSGELEGGLVLFDLVARVPAPLLPLLLDAKKQRPQDREGCAWCYSVFVCFSLCLLAHGHSLSNAISW